MTVRAGLRGQVRKAEVRGGCGHRIVLVMPGDVLIFGNVGLGFDAEEAAKHLATLKDLLQLAAVVVLQEDIEIAAAQEAPVRIGFEAAGGGQFEIGTPYPKLDKDYYARGRE